MIDRELFQQALEALESVTLNCEAFDHARKSGQHGFSQECPPMQRYTKATAAIRQLIKESK